jgi:hypothetical protein
MVEMQGEKCGSHAFGMTGGYTVRWFSGSSFVERSESCHEQS